MPRRRMLDPDIWNDSRVKRLTPTERLLFIGMISYADDEGRLLADPAYLRSKIFPYDDFTLDNITSMRNHIIEVNPNLHLYQNSEEEYLCFRKWSRYQKPSHPQPSKLPKPPETPELQESVQEAVQESVQLETGIVRSQVSLGQSSLGKVRVGQVRAVQEDFTEYLDSEKDLTDFLTTTLQKYMPAAPQQAMSVVKRMWHQVTNVEMDGPSFQIVFSKLKTCNLDTFATSVVKSAKYSVGKRKPTNYIQAVFDDQMKEKPTDHPP